MNKKKIHKEGHRNLDEAERSIVDAIGQSHPDWKDENGECASCVSLSHELADPTHIPAEIEAGAAEGL